MIKWFLISGSRLLHLDDCSVVWLMPWVWYVDEQLEQIQASPLGWLESSVAMVLFVISHTYVKIDLM